jgi:hypothetical protein
VLDAVAECLEDDVGVLHVIEGHVGARLEPAARVGRVLHPLRQVPVVQRHLNKRGVRQGMRLPEKLDRESHSMMDEGHQDVEDDDNSHSSQHPDSIFAYVGHESALMTSSTRVE